MINNFNFFLIVFIVIVSSSCNKIEIDNKILLKSTIDKSLKIGEVNRLIFFEKTDESQLSDIDKTLIDFEDKIVFILSGFNLYFFDLNGKFITKLSIGNGPGEILRVISFSIDHKKNLVYILNDPYYISIYNYQGKYIDKFKYEGMGASDILPIENNRALLYNYFIGTQIKNFAGIYDFNSLKITDKFIPDKESPYPELNLITFNNFPTYNKRKFLICPNIFGLFEFKDSIFTKLIEFDLGNKSVTESFAKKFNIKGKRSFFREEAINNHYTPYLYTAFCFKGYYFVILDNENADCYVINEKNTKQIYMNGKITEYFGLSANSSILYPCGYGDNCLIFRGNPLDFYENDEEQKPKEIVIDGHNIKIEYDSNPFLIIVK